MTPDARAFAADWAAGWNSHDLDRILSHYREDVVFTSRKAEALVGRGRLEGRDALRDYWSQALEAQPDLAFEVLDVFEGFDTLVITYRNHKGRLAAETLQFDSDGRVLAASACHREG
ncbi:nuclear transport factor 2 family protein [Sulfitobacter sp. D35]|uniref:nuclear transport factor 2 family protein n=1 Tax=Sulfitobacter sp. D35 TaxID=3083252 RepID=UPI00296F8308|nr:nuclear transport factor 2 family protein [Sulfitobacter sp. D35]MDW4499510.1 nuclear transport factor 2 family protein [Sulfitobacter sp. D35]